MPLLEKNVEESKMSDRNRIENKLKTNEIKPNLKRIKVQIKKGNKSPKRIWKKVATLKKAIPKTTM